MRIEQLKAEIARLQGIQKKNAPSTAAWQKASEQLKPLFEEMAILSKGKPL